MKDLNELFNIHMGYVYYINLLLKYILNNLFHFFLSHSSSNSLLYYHKETQNNILKKVTKNK